VSTMPYTLVDITTADIAFKATGKTLNQVFESAGLALTDIMVKGKVEENIDVKIELREEETEILLQQFLSEILYYLDGEGIVFKSIKVKTDGKSLIAVMKGEKFNPNKHVVEVDVKAVTYHKLELKKIKDTYECRVVLDI